MTKEKPIDITLIKAREIFAAHEYNLLKRERILLGHYDRTLAMLIAHKCVKAGREMNYE